MSIQLILITGATAHLGFEVLLTALEMGYRARIALRRLEQAEKIKNTKSMQPYLDDIEFVVVSDITALSAYEAATTGVDGVIHCASPITSSAGVRCTFCSLKHGTANVSVQTDWESLYYKPAQQVTISMLSAAAKDSSVKRVVMTSTCLVVEPKNGADKAGRESCFGL